MRRLLTCCGLLALGTALLPTAACAMAETPRDYQEQLDCTSARSQQLLAAEMHANPRDNAWLLEVLDAMGMNRHCNDLDEHLFANYLERQAANDVVQEPIGQPATVREAIQWERKAEFEATPQEVAHDLAHIHSRLLTRGFALEPWTPAAADVPMLRAMPQLRMSAPGTWTEATQLTANAMSFRLSLSFVNKASRSLYWDAHTLYVRAAPGGPYELMFSCMRDGLEGPRFTVNRATVAPGGHVNVLCQLANTGLPLSGFDAAWFERIRSADQQWFLEGPPSDGGTYDYRATLARFASERSHTAAAPYLKSMSCNQRSDCLVAKVAWLQSPLYQWLRDGGAGLLAGIVLAGLLGFCQRARIARMAPWLVGAIVVLYVAVVGWALSGDYGLGAIAVAFSGGRAAAGAVLGVLALKLWAGRDKGMARP